MKTLFCALLALVAVASQATAKAYFQSKSEMIEKAEVIAIITINKVQDLDPAESSGYGKTGVATVESVIKGDIGKSFTLHGSERHKCGSCPIRPGRFIAFLRKNGERWAGSNHDYSLRPITEDQVAWYVADGNRHEMKPADLKAVIAEIRAALDAKKTEPKKP